MSKIKVSTLTGPLLDYWVGRCNDDSKEYFLSEGGSVCFVRTGTITAVRYSPSTDWSQGGPIIERERIMVEPFETWFAHIYTGDPAGNYAISQEGTTPLVSAMRAFVTFKFGGEVDE